jgi:predicted AlkP superfamily pyrophosphatase or phosphodiesterase
MTLGCALAMLLLLGPGRPASGPQAASSARRSAGRASALAMFARAYYPGRSGQIAVVPKEGEFITRRGTDFMHGSPWDYDVRIPFLLWGPGRVRKGAFGAPVAQQDMAPTLARMLGVVLPGATGRPLEEALVPGTRPPRAMLLLVLDGMRADYLDRFAAELPTLTRLRREGAAFDHARVNYAPSITSAGHATIATGTDPRLHGIVTNSIFDRPSGKDADIFPALSPRNLMSLALADVWNLETDGQAVIATQVSIGRAGALAGHGACLLGARPTLYAAYDLASGHWQTDPACFRLHGSYGTLDSRSVWEREGGTWMGHEVADPDSVRRTAPFAAFEGDALVGLLEREPIGQDEVTDLVLANFKIADFIGHAYGPDSAELRSGLAETDRQIGRILALLDRKAGREVVVGITADHGMPSEPSPGGRHYAEDVVKLLHERFDPEGKLVTQYGAENSQFFVDRRRLAELGLTLEQVRDAVQALPFIFAAFTEDEVRRSADSLPRTTRP